MDIHLSQNCDEEAIFVTKKKLGLSIYVTNYGLFVAKLRPDFRFEYISKNNNLLTLKIIV